MTRSSSTVSSSSSSSSSSSTGSIFRGTTISSASSSSRICSREDQQQQQHQYLPQHCTQRPRRRRRGTGVTTTTTTTTEAIMSKRRKIVYGWFNFIFLCGIMLAAQFTSVHSLKDLKIFVPDAVIMGNAATLSCQFELEKASLYSVRWYFESEEFYRYVPKESPPARTFPVSGITVDSSQSDATSVTLRGVTRDLTGTFQCEVSEDAPLFHTDIRQARMQVVELPKQDPQMQLEKTHITTLDNFRAVCTVGTSFPPANITWFINSKKIHRSPYQRITYRSFEGTPTFSSLDMFPHSQVLQDIYQTMPPFQTSLTVMCEISILHIYTKSAQQLIIVSDLVTTISPNLLGLDGSNNRRKGPNGDPDNSALTDNAASFVSHDASTIWWAIAAASVVLSLSALDTTRVHH